MARHGEAHDPSGFRPGKTVSEQASGVVPLAFCLLDWSRQAKGMRAILNRWFQPVAKTKPPAKRACPGGGRQRRGCPQARLPTGLRLAANRPTFVYRLDSPSGGVCDTLLGYFNSLKSPRSEE